MATIAARVSMTDAKWGDRWTDGATDHLGGTGETGS